MGIKGFDERLTNARKEKGYTQEELSVKLGVTPQAVSKWERGMGYPDLETLYHLSEILGCSLDYLLNKVQGREKLTEDGDELQRKLLLDKIHSQSWSKPERVLFLFLKKKADRDSKASAS